MKVFSFWEHSPYSKLIPPYVLLGLASMRYFLQENFVLLTKNNVEDKVDFDFSEKHFFFAANKDKKKNHISHLTAKSDFIRFRFIQQHGGFWLDADSIVLNDFHSKVRAWVKQFGLVWHSEAMFGAKKDNEIINQVVSNCLNSHRMQFANPGNVKEILKNNKEKFFSLPYEFFTPSTNFSYNANAWELIFDKEVSSEDFLKNSCCDVLKLYNSNISSETDYSDMTVEKFLETDTTLAKIFLHLNSDKKLWLSMTADISNEII